MTSFTKYSKIIEDTISSFKNDALYDEIKNRVCVFLCHTVIGIKAHKGIDFQTDLRIEKTLDSVLKEFLSLSNQTEIDHFVEGLKWMKIGIQALKQYEIPLE